MNRIGVQTKTAVPDSDPAAGFALLRQSGFSCADFSLNAYLLNTALYQLENNGFFNQSTAELERFFTPHKQGAREAGIEINQMHMPYPLYVPNGNAEFNQYLAQVVAPKSLDVCAFFQCRYIVVHGFKLSYFLGSEEAEWARTEEFLETLAPMARERGIVICIENLYSGQGSHIVEGTCCDAAKAAERIDRLNDKYGAEVFGFCFDTGHANLVGLDFERFLTTLGYRLKVLHIHDNDGVRDLHQIPFTFTKSRENMPSTDWEGFIRGLRAIDYTGVLSFETAPVLTTFPEEMRGDALRLIARIGAYFANQIKAGDQ